ncbi:hypothetical protein P12x_000443 [Tundrisphaera lichenicola]|uniref:hypothetical protein n=1 Tax=Tundrisphaera lichenicola TaxID=2029860 RepID=UPI003EBB42AD
MIRRHGTTLLLAFLATPLFFSLSGCDAPTDDLPRQSVSGSVTLDGKPLASGSITFDPVGPGNANPVAGGAPISNGSYSLGAANGLTPGNYLVSIISGGDDAPSAAEAPGMPPRKAKKDPIPAKYNTKSTLKVEVKAGDSSSKDFELDSK